MHQPISPESLGKEQSRRSAAWLSRAMQLCSGSVVFGQLLFFIFIAAYYGVRTVSGDFAAWNDKPIITGYVSGDPLGNFGFALHVLLAGAVTVAGLVQILPFVRQRHPRLHRWSGRFYVTAIVVLAIGGLAITWLRGSYLDPIGALGTSFNAVLLIGFAALAWRAAWRRDFATHRRWALRLFVAAGAVWFMRLGYIVWGASTGGLGIGEALDGPFDLALAYANSIIPLAVLEGYFRAQRAGRQWPRYAMAAVLAVSAVLIFAGSIGAWLAMWSPYL